MQITKLSKFGNQSILDRYQLVHAVQHLAHLINNQELKCDFQYYQIDYHANIPVLVLSEGRSMLPVRISPI